MGFKDMFFNYLGPTSRYLTHNAAKPKINIGSLYKNGTVAFELQ